MPERDAVPRQGKPGRVVIRGEEEPRRAGLAAELRKGESLSCCELDLALDRLLHGVSLVADPVHTCLRLVNVPSRREDLVDTAHSEFYVLFARAGENALAGRASRATLPRAPELRRDAGQVKAAETAGDSITRDLIQLLNTQYMTPFDREDIYQLATEIDDVVDYLEEASDLLGLYGVEMPTRHAVEQCAIIVQAVRATRDGAAQPEGMRGVQQALVELKALEDEGDRVLRDALASLFRDERIDPLVVIRWKDIYEALERSARRLRDRRQRDREHRRQEHVARACG